MCREEAVRHKLGNKTNRFGNLLITLISLLLIVQLKKHIKKY